MLRRQPPACAAIGSRHRRAYWTTALSRTSWRKWRLRSWGVRRSTFRPPKSVDSSISSPAMPSRPGDRPSTNSTSTSTSLSGPKSARRAEPNSASQRMSCTRQKEASSAFGIDNCGLIPGAVIRACRIRTSFSWTGSVFRRLHHPGRKPWCGGSLSVSTQGIGRFRSSMLLRDRMFRSSACTGTDTIIRSRGVPCRRPTVRSGGRSRG